MKMCAFEGCVRPASKKSGFGLCSGHYAQKWEGRDLVPLNQTKRPSKTPPRIKYTEQPCPIPGLVGPCHIFSGYKDKIGYGKVNNREGSTCVHVVVWVRERGPVPEGLEIDHRCMVKPCCNINHLRAVTHKVNCTENIRSKGEAQNASV